MGLGIMGLCLISTQIPVTSISRRAFLVCAFLWSHKLQKPQEPLKDTYWMRLYTLYAWPTCSLLNHPSCIWRTAIDRDQEHEGGFWRVPCSSSEVNPSAVNNLRFLRISSSAYLPRHTRSSFTSPSSPLLLVFHQKVVFNFMGTSTGDPTCSDPFQWL